jgi:hypothetical protein
LAKWTISTTDGPPDATFLQSFPKGAKIVPRQFHGGAFRVDENNEVKVHESCIPETDSQKVVTVGIPREAMDFLARAFTVGIPREAMDFLARTVKAGHLRTVAVHLSDMVKHVLRMNFGRDDYSLAKERAVFLWKWSNGAKALAEDERRLHASLHPHLQHLLRGKRLFLLREVLTSLKYPDSTLVDEISSGFTLHGWMQESNIFPKQLDDELVGCTYDLRSAYKQFGVSAETRNKLRLLVGMLNSAYLVCWG